ncbi:MAG: proline iminopeptidase-family hydrolase [Bacteroidota bacterium]
MKHLLYLPLLLLIACTPPAETTMEATDAATPDLTTYHDLSADEGDQLSGGAKMIPITTPLGDFKVWTKRIGNNPDVKVLLLHGGPGANHAYFECFDSYFPGAGIEYYYYDQLGSRLSDVPTDPSLWTIDRFVDEVEQVRQALGLEKDNFYVLGHSWGGILGVEYALKHQDKMNGLIISNMMMDVPAYNTYAQEVLGPQLPPEILSKIQGYEAAEDYGNEEYLGLIYANYYPKHVLRMPLEEWPEPVNRGFDKLNEQIYVGMQGPSEFGIKGDASLKEWNRMADLGKITIPVLTIGGQYDTMDPEHMRAIADDFPNGSHLHCPKGSHMSFYDDQQTYFEGLIDWIEKTEAGS